jgi:cytochrome d ubiquinol oxidase subunit I
MKLAAMEALYEGGTHEPLTVVGSIKIPEMLSFLATHSTAGYVPGINNLLEGGYTLPDGSTALSADEKMVNGKKAITALADFRRAKEEGDEASMQIARSALKEYMPYFGYGYIQNKEDLVPHVGLLFWSFRVMVGLGMYFILFFLVILFLVWKKRLAELNWLHWISLWSIALGKL